MCKKETMAQALAEQRVEGEFGGVVYDELRQLSPDAVKQQKLRDKGKANLERTQKKLLRRIN